MPAAIPIAAAVIGGLMANKTSKDASEAAAELQRENAKKDPRVDAMLFGQNNDGLLSEYRELGKTPQNAGLEAYGTGSDTYLGANGTQDMQNMRSAANDMMGSGLLAPTAKAANIGAPAWAVGNMVKAPSQNTMDLRPSYDRFINGTPGANPYLDKLVQGGIDQSGNQFKRFQDSATENLQENILPGIRSASVLSGQYGGSRQGVAEGNAIGDHTKAMAQASSEFGQANTNAAVGAKSGAYETDSNRALAATTGLGAEQYGVAKQDAATKNAAEFMNVGQVLDLRKSQAGLEQQTNLANLNVAGDTQRLNSANKIAGIGATSGLLGSTVAAATNQDNYGLNRAAQTGGLLQPYLSQNPVPQQPIYSNTAGATMGGAMGGLALYNQFMQANKAGGSPSGTPAGGQSGQYYDGYGWSNNGT